MDIEKDPYVDKDEAKSRMCVKFDNYINFNDLLLALIRKDELKLVKYREMDNKIISYNSEMEKNIDAANPTELKRLVNTYKNPVFKLE